MSRPPAIGRGLPLALTEPWLNHDGGPLGGGPVTAEGALDFESI